MWRGWADGERADAYEAIFRDDVRQELAHVPGYRGAYLLRPEDADGVEFVSLTLFDSLDAVRAFAGERYETAVVLPAARAVLRDYDRIVRHYTLAVSPSDPT